MFFLNIDGLVGIPSFKDIRWEFAWMLKGLLHSDVCCLEFESLLKGFLPPGVLIPDLGVPKSALEYDCYWVIKFSILYTNVLKTSFLSGFLNCKLLSETLFIEFLSSCNGLFNVFRITFILLTYLIK